MNRQVLKAQAKDVLKNHYWPMVGLGVLLMIFGGGSGSANTIRAVFTDDNSIALATYSTIMGDVNRGICRESFNGWCEPLYDPYFTR